MVSKMAGLTTVWCVMGEVVTTPCGPWANKLVQHSGHAAGRRTQTVPAPTRDNGADGVAVAAGNGLRDHAAQAVPATQAIQGFKQSRVAGLVSALMGQPLCAPVFPQRIPSPPCSNVPQQVGLGRPRQVERLDRFHPSMPTIGNTQPAACRMYSPQQVGLSGPSQVERLDQLDGRSRHERYGEGQRALRRLGVDCGAKRADRSVKAESAQQSKPP